MKTQEKKQRQVVEIALSNENWKRFNAALERHHSIKVRWVADAIVEKLERDGEK